MTSFQQRNLKYAVLVIVIKTKHWKKRKVMIIFVIFVINNFGNIQHSHLLFNIYEIKKNSIKKGRGKYSKNHYMQNIRNIGVFLFRRGRKKLKSTEKTNTICFWDFVEFRISTKKHEKIMPQQLINFLEIPYVIICPGDCVTPQVISCYLNGKVICYCKWYFFFHYYSFSALFLFLFLFCFVFLHFHSNQFFSVISFEQQRFHSIQ